MLNILMPPPKEANGFEGGALGLPNPPDVGKLKPGGNVIPGGGAVGVGATATELMSPPNAANGLTAGVPGVVVVVVV